MTDKPSSNHYSGVKKPRRRSNGSKLIRKQNTTFAYDDNFIHKRKPIVYSNTINNSNNNKDSEHIQDNDDNNAIEKHHGRVTMSKTSKRVIDCLIAMFIKQIGTMCKRVVGTGCLKKVREKDVITQIRLQYQPQFQDAIIENGSETLRAYQRCYEERKRINKSKGYSPVMEGRRFKTKKHNTSEK